MSQDLSTEISPEIINSLILTGDMSKLTALQQTQYYGAVCKSLGLNPLTQPFAIIVLQGKKTLYALKACTQQLCGINKINTEVKDRKTIDSIYIVSARATMPDGRFTDDDGIVAITGLKGAELANAMMKAVTKAKRRAVLALCGLGMPDETEVEDIKHDIPVETGKSRVETIIDAHATEVKEDANKEEVKPETKVEQPKKSKTTAKKEDIKPNTEPTNGQSLPPGHAIAQGVITDTPTYAEIGAEKKPKWVFKMGELKLGTFDKAVFEGICAIMDLQKETPILLNVEYKERISGEKTLMDIVKFSQITSSQVPI